MAGLPHTLPDNEGHLPDCQPLALFVAGLFQRLGGRLAIDRGRRCVIRPEAGLFALQGEELPQLPGAEPHERFHCDDEWRGALKLAEFWLNRLSDADKDFAFSLFAPVSTHSPDEFDFRNLLH